MPSFVHVAISGLMLLVWMERKLKLLYILYDKADFQKLFFDFTDIYLLFSKIQIKSLKFQALKFNEICEHENGGKHQNFVLYFENKYLAKSDS